jgi:hypothetical protein
MDFKTLLESRPEVTQDRHALSFSTQAPLGDVARAFSKFGVVMLKEVLPAAVLTASADAFRLYLRSSRPDQGASAGRLEWGRGENDAGSWHSPWMIRHGSDFPAAAVLSAVVRSWAWEVVEEICQSSNIAVLLKFCTARHSVDRALGVGAHQDAKVVASDVPLSLWIPLQDIVPGHNSGLGFVVPHPGQILPTSPHNDVGAEYVLGDLRDIWIPPYALGDLSIHSRLSPHFTTGYGTLSDRFSLEIRAMARSAASPKHVHPAMFVARRDGIPTIVEVNSSAEVDAHDFLRSAQFAPAVSKQLRQDLD